jgi:hypothetical protein
MSTKHQRQRIKQSAAPVAEQLAHAALCSLQTCSQRSCSSQSAASCATMPHRPLRASCQHWPTPRSAKLRKMAKQRDAGAGRRGQGPQEVRSCIEAGPTGGLRCYNTGCFHPQASQARGLMLMHPHIVRQQPTVRVEIHTTQNISEILQGAQWKKKSFFQVRSFVTNSQKQPLDIVTAPCSHAATYNLDTLVRNGLQVSNEAGTPWEEHNSGTRVQPRRPHHQG